MSRADRVGLVAALSASTLFVIFLVSFGAKTECTNTLSNDCDAIDVWAWGTLIASVAVAIVGGVLISSRRRAKWLAVAVAVIVVVGCIAMYTVS